MTRRLVCVLWLLVCGLSVGLSGCDKKDPSNSAATAQAEARVSGSAESVLDRVKRTGVMRVAWTGYPPYTQKDPATGNVTGFSADLIRRLIELWGRDIKIEWVETNWARMKADITTGRFDVLIDPVFQTIPRASEACFTRPFGFFGYGIPVVRVDDNRFNTLDDFNKSEIRLAITQGVASHDFVKSRLPQATIVTLPGTNDVPLTEVMLGKADASFADEPTVRRFLAAHGDKVKAIFLDKPPVHVAAGFMIPAGDPKWRDFLNTSLDFLENSGETKLISRKHRVPYFPTISTFIEQRESPDK